MKLSTTTLKYLTNFSQINDNIIIRKGSTLKTMSNTKSFLATVEVEEVFTEDLCIYSLSKFLKLYQCITTPSLEVEGGTVIISNSMGESLEYRLSDESIVTAPPSKQLNLPSVEVSFTLQNVHLKKCKKVASALGEWADTLAITGDGETIHLRVLDKKNSGSDKYSVAIGETSDTFCFYVKLENLKLMEGSYEVEVSEKNLMELTSMDSDVTYFCACEPDSTYEAGGMNAGYNTEEVTEEVTEEEPYVTEGELAQEEDTYQPYKGGEEVTEEDLLEMVN
jgi:hypothetical protein